MPVNFLAGLVVGVITFGAWGMGFNFATVGYFSLATEISGEKGRSRTIAVMFILMILVIILTSISLYRLLDPYSEAVLIRTFWLVGLLSLVMGLLGLVGLEKRHQNLDELAKEERHSWKELIQKTRENSQVILFFWYLILMLAAILGQDVLLEPFAAEAFGLPVNVTSRITSIWGGAFLLSMAAAAILDRKTTKRTQAIMGAWGGILAFMLISLSGLLGEQGIFYLGVVFLGTATGLATVSNLSLMLDMTLPGTEGLYIGIWGMANAFSRLVGNVTSGAVRDISSDLFNNPVGGYVVVFLLQAAMLAFSLILLRRIDVSAFQKRAASISLVERAALASET
jgi:BCD family chlorophyll transporter-like MFS transporter